jgi:HEAT repeat protein
VTRRPISLEGTTSALILYRVERGRAEKVRTFSESCQIDAGGRTLYWLTDVNPTASVALLKNLLRPAGNTASDAALPRHLVSEALLAITAHEAPEAVTTLIDLARNGAESRVRSDALFWLSQRAGEKAAGAITDAIANDPDTKVKERAVFALSQLPKDEGIPKLIDVARTNRNPRVRQQAVFWLGQSKDSRALAFFEEILLK